MRSKRKSAPSSGRTSAWWVRAFLAVGRPAVVLLGLAVLAPAERHLAQVAGYDPRVCWGVAVIVSAYGGMAALTAAYVDRAHPDRRTAVVGAVGAVMTGALSQVFAHLIATGYIGVTPRPPVLLVVLPSVAPVAVVGHLLHLSWVKVEGAPTKPLTAPESAQGLDPAPEAPELADEPSDGPLSDLVTYAEAARITGRQESTIRGWVHTGYAHGRKIVPITRGGKTYLRRDDLPAAGLESVA